MIRLTFSSIVKSWSYPTTLIFVSWGSLIHNITRSITHFALSHWLIGENLLIRPKIGLTFWQKTIIWTSMPSPPNRRKKLRHFQKASKKMLEIFPFNRIQLTTNTERQTLQMYPNLNLQYIRNAQFYELPSFMLFYFYYIKINQLIND